MGILKLTPMRRTVFAGIVNTSVQAVSFIWFGAQQLHGHSCFTHSDILVGMGVSELTHHASRACTLTVVKLAAAVCILSSIVSLFT